MDKNEAKLGLLTAKRLWQFAGFLQLCLASYKNLVLYVLYSIIQRAHKCCKAMIVRVLFLQKNSCTNIMTISLSYLLYLRTSQSRTRKATRQWAHSSW